MDDDGPVSDPRPTGRGNARLAQTIWDLVRSMALVLVVVGVLVWFSRSPETETVRAVDTAPLLSVAQTNAPFEVVMPKSVNGLIATSVRLEPSKASGPEVVWHVGWVTPDTQYVQLSQSRVASAAYLAEQTTNGVAGETITLQGRQWQRYENEKRRSLVNVENGVTTVVTGTLAWQPLESFAASLQSLKS